MCGFFSLVSKNGDIYYFDDNIRKEILLDKLNYKTDNHSSIIHYFFGGQYQDFMFPESDKDDLFNQYKYNPLTRELIIDKLNIQDDSKIVKQKCLELDFKTIAPELIIKPIINPEDIKHDDIVNGEEIELLKKWSAVVDSIENSEKNSIKILYGNSENNFIKILYGDSVWNFVWYFVWGFAYDRVWGLIRKFVWEFKRDSMSNFIWIDARHYVWDSIENSVYNFIMAYISSFFNIAKWQGIEHEEGENPFQSCIDLWGRGLIPSYDGETWRLHNMSNDARIIYEWVPENKSK